jgi:hypothetical protein
LLCIFYGVARPLTRGVRFVAYVPGVFPGSIGLPLHLYSLRSQAPAHLNEGPIFFALPSIAHQVPIATSLRKRIPSITPDRPHARGVP